MIPTGFMNVTMSLPASVAKELLKKGYLEVVLRDLNKRYLPFVKMAVSSQSPLLQSVGSYSSIVNTPFGIANVALSAANLAATKAGFRRVERQLAKIASVGYLNAALSSANLVVSAAGFVIINRKINSLSRTVDGIASKIEKIEKKMDNEIIQEYQTIALQFSNYTAMVEGFGSVDAKAGLEWLSRTQPFMNKIMNNMASDAMNKELALEMLFTLLPAYTAVMIMAIREYRFATGRLFAATNSYSSLYEQLRNEKFTEDVANQLFLEKKEHIRDVINAVEGQKLLIGENYTQVQDEMKLLEVIETKEDYQAYKKAMFDSIKQAISEAVPDISRESGISEEECREVLEQACATA